MTLYEVIHNPVVKGALVGLLTSAYVDIAAFRKWQSFHEAAEYGWKLAAWRWFQGAVLGALSAGGIEIAT